MMVEQPPVPFETLLSEGIPHKLIRNEEGDGMSVDWCKYSSLEDTQGRNGSKSEYGVVSFNVGKIRNEKFLFDLNNDISEPLEVKHDPKEYKSHSLIKKIPWEEDPDYDEKRGLLNSIRLFLQEISEWGLIDKEDFLNIAKKSLEKHTGKRILRKIRNWIGILSN